MQRENAEVWSKAIVKLLKDKNLVVVARSSDSKKDRVFVPYSLSFKSVGIVGGGLDSVLDVVMRVYGEENGDKVFSLDSCDICPVTLTFSGTFIGDNREKGVVSFIMSPSQISHSELRLVMSQVEVDLWRP
ncbi:MAG: hypothetical protein KJ592_00345 [Nanoarchaeota archaeon]|nr:hypothetical protein [Nanoarchaeota archaeon]